MKRRGLLALLGLGGGLLLPQVVTHKATRHLPILEAEIAGFDYYQSDALVAQIQPGDLLQLKREPTNKHDHRAIEVYWQEHKVGYVPKVSNRALSKLMDNNENISAEVASLAPGYWKPIRFVVRVGV